MDLAIQTQQLKKRFAQRVKGRVKWVEAVAGVDMAVQSGEIYGFLGPNGAGKTTTLRMLTTLLPMDSGEAVVAGFDLRSQAHMVRRHIGYVSQLGGADLNATGWENLILAGQLYGMTSTQVRNRAKELVEVFDLGQIVQRGARTYSGGQRRRLEVALGIIHRPEVLFLDEPTTGLDPQNRHNLWQQIRQLQSTGTTVFLTTHYLEEADALADRLAIMDSGRIISEGAPDQLKQQVAGDVIVIEDSFNPNQLSWMARLLEKEAFVRRIHTEEGKLLLYVADAAANMQEVFKILHHHSLRPQRVSLSQASLDDVFLKATGRSLRDVGQEGEGQ